LCFVASAWLALAAWGDPPPPLTLDPNFRPSFTTTTGVELTAVALQPDGKLVVAGRFDLFHRHPYNGLVRLDDQGLVDTGFAFWPCVEGTVYAVAIQPDGRIVLGGDFVRVAARARSGLARLNVDGSLDEAFAPQLSGQRSSAVRVARVLPDGRIFVGGNFQAVGAHQRGGVARLQANGDLDETFDPGAGVEDGFGVVQDLAPLPEGGVVVAGLFTKFAGHQRPGLVKLEAEGAVNTAFAPALDWSEGLVSVSRVRRQENGRLLIAGRFDRVEGETRAGLARLRETGAADEGFDAGAAWGSLGHTSVHDLALQPDGQIVIAGDFEQIGTTPRRGLARLLPNGALDDGFDPGLGLQWRNGAAGTGISLVLQPNGCVIVAGLFDRLGTEARHLLGRVHADGSVDRAFSAAERLVERVGIVNTILVQPNGCILVGGDFERVQNQVRHALARLRPFGGLDETFHAGVEPGGVVNALALEPGGKLFVGGRFATVHAEAHANLVRLQTSGRLDRSFDPGTGPNGEVYCATRQPDGQIVIGGRFDVVDGAAHDRLARLDAQGRVDADFNPQLSARVDIPDVYTLAAQPDGGLLVGGYFDAVNGHPKSSLARLQPNGSLDPTFGGSSLIGGDLPLVTAIALESSGRVLVSGAFAAVDGAPRRGIARLGPEGQLDPSFAPGTAVGGGELPTVYGLALGSGDRAVIVGEFDSFNETPRRNAARLDPDGTLDATFDPQGCMDWWALATAVEANGSILVGGPFTTIAGEPRQGLARFRAAPAGPPALWISLETTTVAVAWDPPGRLQSSDSPLGPWRDEPPSTSPASESPNQPARFFRVVRAP